MAKTVNNRPSIVAHKSPNVLFTMNTAGAITVGYAPLIHSHENADIIISSHDIGIDNSEPIYLCEWPHGSNQGQILCAGDGKIPNHMSVTVDGAGKYSNNRKT